MSYRGI
ncbi:UNVERIFIED_CONTAM: hypothetical protein GTU68_031995 [Idotea baltica]|nr:hypothetical protein [Idotea baltica]